MRLRSWPQTGARAAPQVWQGQSRPPARLARLSGCDAPGVWPASAPQRLLLQQILSLRQGLRLQPRLTWLSRLPAQPWLPWPEPLFLQQGWPLPAPCPRRRLHLSPQRGLPFGSLPFCRLVLTDLSPYGSSCLPCSSFPPRPWTMIRAGRRTRKPGFFRRPSPSANAADGDRYADEGSQGYRVV